MLTPIEEEMSFKLHISKEELGMIKEALEDHTKVLQDFLAGDENNEELMKKTIKFEQLCQDFKIPGFEFS
jgi:hypothetical protein